MARLLASIPRPDPAAERWHEVDPQAMLDLEALGGGRPAILGLGLAAFGVRGACSESHRRVTRCENSS